MEALNNRLFCELFLRAQPRKEMYLRMAMQNDIILGFCLKKHQILAGNVLLKPSNSLEGFNWAHYALDNK